MHLEKEFWRAAGYRSTRGEPIWHTAQTQIKAGFMVPSDEGGRREALQDARSKRTDAVSEHDVWLSGKKDGQPDNVVKKKIDELLKQGKLIPSTILEVSEARKQGEEFFFVDSQKFGVQVNIPGANFEEMRPKAPYIPSDYTIEGGLPPETSFFSSSLNSFAARESTGQSLTAAETWYWGVLNSIPKEEIQERIKAGIRTGIMAESSPDQIYSAIRKAERQVQQGPRAFSQVDIYSYAQPDLRIKKAIVLPPKQNAPYTATSRRGTMPIREIAKRRPRVTTSPVLDPHEPREVLTTSGAKEVVRVGRGVASTNRLRQLKQESINATSKDVVDARIRQYEEFGVAQQYQEWARNVSPELEPAKAPRTTPALPLRGRGGAILAISKLGVGDRKMQSVKHQNMKGVPARASSSWTTGEKVAVAFAGIGVIGGVGLLINKAIRK